LVWWNGEDCDLPTLRDYDLPTVGVAKMVGVADGKPVVLAVTVGHNDGHHSHVDIGSFVYHIGSESLIPDAGRGKYSKEYFRQTRYENLFTSAYSHNIPRIGGQMQQPGREFGGNRRHYGTILERGEQNGHKYVALEFQNAYAIPELRLARRTLTLNSGTGEAVIHDVFAFASDALPIEEAFVTWHEVSVNGDAVTISGQETSIVVCAPGAVFDVEYLERESRENERSGILKRISTPVNGTEFTLRITPKD
jgi:hypothetical protein